ncbi:aminotransferase class I/II-fold pyridoxal phosphate-dependent enzyme [Thiothrix lacustris]|uniref:Aminotransferase class I/II-fold pyridoxal phosphate-dependent enzyme n=1 Tax=Thiothrix lacustris TaxID=525917 RepID=A0ABY9MTW1_9GAMM|nr:aminotransferase class I/II-fold pyridoxal phosphate-dependent enzyme [Thiothrix lacustris]WML91882.1 aminotransferase class I/II-fold pyridoxal phosphate-dependent enzyme [Thiothrix lacustris]
MNTPVLHFNRAHYLDLSPYPLRVTQPVATGMPAVLFESSQERLLAKQMAAMQGQAAAVLGMSTLHLFWDWFELVRQTPVQVFMAQDTYPFIQLLAKRAFTPQRLQTFRDMAELAKQLAQVSPASLVMVVADSWSLRRNQPFAVKSCLKLLSGRRGLLVLDDTQTCGLLGHNPSRQLPFGGGGGGILPWVGVATEQVVLITSLAKALGTPVAVLSGNAAVVDCFRQQSHTRTYCSPPSPWLVEHALHALQQNAQTGGRRRRSLVGHIHYFQAQLQGVGIHWEGGIFPVQKLVFPYDWQCVAIYRYLRQRQVETVVTRSDSGACALTVVLRAGHRREDIRHLVILLTQALAQLPIPLRGRVRSGCPFSPELL